MDTLALTLAAVLLSLVDRHPARRLGGTVAGAAERVVTPVLDIMQTMPTFVYLAPLTLFFLIGPAAAVIATLIYAMPPVIRLTAHGHPPGHEASMEASRSLGATRWQILRTGAAAAGQAHHRGRHQPDHHGGALHGDDRGADRRARAWARSCCGRSRRSTSAARSPAASRIVILAIVLDRVTTAASERAEATLPAGCAGARQRVRAVGCSSAVAWRHRGGGLPVAHATSGRRIFPGPARGGVIGFTIDDAVNAAADWTRLNLYDVTNAITRRRHLRPAQPAAGAARRLAVVRWCARSSWPLTWTRGRGALAHRGQRLPRPAARHRPVGGRHGDAARRPSSPRSS